MVMDTLRELILGLASEALTRGPDVIHQPNVNVHQVYGRIGTDDKGIGEMKVARQTQSQVVTISNPHFHSLSHMKAPVLIGRIWGKRFLSESEYAPLRFEIGHDSFPIAPQQSKANWRDAGARHESTRFAQGVTPYISPLRLGQENDRKYLADSVYP